MVIIKGKSTYYDNQDQVTVDFSSIENISSILDELENVHGRIVASVAHNSNSTDDEVIDLYSYDSEGRVISTYKYIPGTGVGWTKIVYVYTFSGSLKSKEVYPQYLTWLTCNNFRI